MFKGQQDHLRARAQSGRSNAPVQLVKFGAFLGRNGTNGQPSLGHGSNGRRGRMKTQVKSQTRDWVQMRVFSSGELRCIHNATGANSRLRPRRDALRRDRRMDALRPTYPPR